MDRQLQVVEVDLASFTEALLKDYPVKSAHGDMPRHRLVIDVPGGRARLAVSQIYGSMTGGKPVVNSITGVLMWRQQ